jgi:capsid protein
MTVFQDGQQIEMEWYWQGAEHVDPQKEANAEKTRLESNTTTLAEVYARQGKDWKKQLEQRAKEKKLIEELMPAPVVEPPKDQDQETDKDQGEDDNDDEKENKGAA